MIIDLEQFTKSKLEFLIKVYSGFNLFNDNKWHPYLKLGDKYFAFTHTKPHTDLFIVKPTAAILTGEYYTQFKNEVTYIVSCNPPTKTADKVGGYFYIKPIKNFFLSNGVKLDNLKRDFELHINKRKRTYKHIPRYKTIKTK